MTTLSNTFEGGTNGATITPANSGGASGNAFDSVVIGTGGTCIYDNTHIHSGTLENEQTLGVTAGQVYLAWTTSLASPTELFSRMYLYITANPAATSAKILYLTGAATCLLALTATGKVVLLNAASATVATSTNSITLNAWNRLEFHCLQNATTGTIQARLFLGSSVDSATPTESLDGGATNTGSSAYSAIRLGQANNASSVTYWIGDAAISTTAWVGPALNTYLVPVSASSTSAATVAKNTGKNVSVTSNSAVTILKSIGKGFSVASGSATAISKNVGKGFSVASSTAVSVLKGVGKAVTAISASLVSAVGQKSAAPVFSADTSGRRTVAIGFENRNVMPSQEPRAIAVGDENRRIVA